MMSVMGVAAYPGLDKLFGEIPKLKPGPKDWSPRSGCCGCRKEASWA
jgi:hypothetical protein